MPDYKDFLQIFKSFFYPKNVPKCLKTIFLHIGIPKTGSTSIQKMLSDNRGTLRQQGYFYPALGGFASHYLAYYFGFGAKNKISEFNQQKTRDEHNSFIKDRIHLQINENIILSSEAFSSIRTKEVISKLAEIKKFFPGYCFVIIVYLRRQDHFIESSFNQRTKTGYKEYNIYEYADTGNFDWYEMLSCYSNVFGKENIHVKPFEKTTFSEHGLYHDFLNNLGITDHNRFIFPDNELNKKFNEEIMSMIGYCPEADSKQIVAFLKNVDKNNTRSHNLLSPNKRIEILKKYESSNRKIALEFLGEPDGQLFSEPWPDPNEPWEEYKGITNEKTISILMELITHQHNSLNLVNAIFDSHKKQNNR